MLPPMTPPDGAVLAGHLNQTMVGDLLHAPNFFIDLSNYQGFGRTPAEAMACGCVCLVPALGGASDFMQNGFYSFLKDTYDEADMARASRQMLSLSEAELRAVMLARRETVARYTAGRAAVSEFWALGFG